MLTTEHITGDDITAPAAMATALDWADAYHGVKDKYNTLRGWIAGVRAGQQLVQDALDAQNPDAPGVPKVAVPSKADKPPVVSAVDDPGQGEQP